ncbi:Valine--tRNA ligase [bioreactor metagenome]|uniref:valine--tRNA ligase n=1 Tax=bioreactor metagenome TaxID=1076179 RepID=A0A645HHI0_9ZZZZ
MLCYVLTQTLKLLHPFMPFITEEIWQALPHEGDFLMLADWPVYRPELSFPAEEEAMELIMDVIRAVRTRRAEMNVPPSKKARLFVAAEKTEIFRQGVPFLMRLAYASEVSVSAEPPAQTEGMVTAVTHEARIFMPLSELVDMEKEKARLEKELKKSTGELEGLKAKLSNPGFIGKAPENVVAAERERAEKLQALIDKLSAQLQAM